MENFYPILVIGLRFQLDHMNLEKTQLFEEHNAATNGAKFFVILIRHSEIKMVSDGKKITTV